MAVITKPTNEQIVAKLDEIRVGDVWAGGVEPSGSAAAVAGVDLHGDDESALSVDVDALAAGAAGE